MYRELNKNDLKDVLLQYDIQFIEMQNEFVNILTKIQNSNNIFEIKNICNTQINLIKKDQEIKDLNNIYNMKGELI